MFDPASESWHERSIPPVLLERPEPGIALLRLHRPHARNALSPELQTMLAAQFSTLAEDRQTRCILITGGDQVFAAGGDIGDMLEVGAMELYKRHTERL